MASTILGKRSRETPDSSDPVPLATRSKRRVQPKVYLDDESDDPFITQKIPKSARKLQDIELEDVENSRHYNDSSKLFPENFVPVKHGVLGARLALSPTKIHSYVNTAIAASDEAGKTVYPPTPQTPRRRDALSKKVPVTPRHRAIASGKFGTPRTPRTPTTPSAAIQTVYNEARQLFVRSADPGRLIGREEERKEVKMFVQSHIQSFGGGCMYVSGPPGTGKSALITEVSKEFDESNTLRKAYINCMSVKTSKEILTKLYGDLCGDELTDTDGVNKLHDMFTSRQQGGPIYLVILDEIDHLLTLDLEILYKLFEWSLQKQSRLVLIGIANALDLTDRFLPRLKARNLKPQLLPFLPYTAPQISAIISTRLRSLPSGKTLGVSEFVPFLHPAAIQFCSRKVASQTGDLRKAFDICRRAIDAIEGETKQKHQEKLMEASIMASPSKAPLTENINLSSPSSILSPSRHLSKANTHTLAESLAILTPENAPRATIAHIAKITSSIFSNGATQRLQNLNLQQKAALCALVALEKKKRATTSDIMATPSKSARAAPTIRALYESYAMLCKRDHLLHPLSSTEFRDVVGSLETLSLVNTLDGKAGSLTGSGTPSRKGKSSFKMGTGDEKRVGSCVGEKELEEAVQGAGSSILRGILSGDALD